MKITPDQKLANISTCTINFKYLHLCCLYRYLNFLKCRYLNLYLFLDSFHTEVPSTVPCQSCYCCLYMDASRFLWTNQSEHFISKHCFMVVWAGKHVTNNLNVILVFRNIIETHARKFYNIRRDVCNAIKITWRVLGTRKLCFWRYTFVPILHFPCKASQKDIIYSY